MEQIFNFDLKKISNSSSQEILDREKSLKLFLKTGLPNKKDENWKFTDLNFIINKNFKNITNNQDFTLNKDLKLIDDFEHNNIILVNRINNIMFSIRIHSIISLMKGNPIF